LLGAGKLLPNPLAATQNDGTFVVSVEVDNANAPHAQGRLEVTFTDTGGNSATAVVFTPMETGAEVFSSGSLGPP